MDAKKVDLRHLHIIIVHMNMSGNTSDKRAQTPVVGLPNTDVPVWDVSRRGEGPAMPPKKEKEKGEKKN